MSLSVTTVHLTQGPFPSHPVSRLAGPAWFGLEEAPTTVSLLTIPPSTSCPNPTATQNVAYSSQLTGLGGTGSYGWSVIQGSLPTNLTISPTGLVAGIPTGVQVSNFTLQIKDSAGATGQQSCSITVGSSETSPGSISVTPGSLGFNAVTGVLPPPQPFTVTSSGPSIAYNVSSSLTSSAPANWVLFSPSSGTASGSNPGTVTVSISNVALSFPAGTYTATVNVVPTNTSIGGKSVTITYKVTAANDITVTTPLVVGNAYLLVFGSAAGVPGPPDQNITTGSASGPLAFSVAISYLGGQSANWLAAPASGTAPGAFNVSVQPGSLSPGTYTGFVTLTAAGATTSHQVRVYLVVEAAPDVSMTFVYQPGGPGLGIPGSTDHVGDGSDTGHRSDQFGQLVGSGNRLLSDSGESHSYRRAEFVTTARKLFGRRVCQRV